MRILQERGWVGLNWHLKELTGIVLCLINRGKRERRTEIGNTHLTGASSSECEDGSSRNFDSCTFPIPHVAAVVHYAPGSGAADSHQHEHSSETRVDPGGLSFDRRRGWEVCERLQLNRRGGLLLQHRGQLELQHKPDWPQFPAAGNSQCVWHSETLMLI